MNSEMKAQSKKLLRKKQQTSKSPLNSWRDAVAGWVFIGPMFIGTSILVIFPILSSLTLSFTNWNIVAGYENAEFIGLDNFVALFNDPLFIKSLGNNFLLLLAIPITLFISLTLATIIN